MFLDQRFCLCRCTNIANIYFEYNLNLLSTVVIFLRCAYLSKEAIIICLISIQYAFSREIDESILREIYKSLTRNLLLEISQKRKLYLLYLPHFQCPVMIYSAKTFRV